MRPRGGRPGHVTIYCPRDACAGSHRLLIIARLLTKATPAGGDSCRLAAAVGLRRLGAPFTVLSCEVVRSAAARRPAQLIYAAAPLCGC